MRKWLVPQAFSLRFSSSHLESSQADVAQLVEQSIRNALSLAYVVVEYGGLRVVLGGSRVSLSTVCTAFCTAI